MNGLVSIIMPAHNSEQTILNSIYSVLLQSYENFELIIVDDASTDKTSEVILNKVNDKRIKVISLRKNVGIAGARNIGIQAARGRYIAFLDSDDFWFDHKLSSQINSFKDHSCVVSFSAYVRGRELFDIRKDTRASILKQSSLVSEAKTKLTLKDLQMGNPVGMLTAMIDLERISKRDIVFQNYKHEDYLLWLKIASFNQRYFFNYTDEPQGYYLEHVSQTSNKLKSAIWTYDVYRDGMGYSRAKSTMCFVGYMVRQIRRRFA
ncbi:glycosyltransferase family 2 protein [Lacticaseibacillus zhaodongensis]|uniref:glycosyltransferase family 2 protein n=1 Tax=Lacticaseibacillus zhaodongensis TaxID=2668065 RepID=UPI0012D327C4|nr:glycosyltransferase family 2 protein [Lacticaseibacillus zhaodongensis]